jgi:drug/metabolite transporter (DMT)-like permease
VLWRPGPFREPDDYMNPKYIGIAAALGSAASWAVGSILFKRLGERLSSPAMTLAKQILSVGLLAIALVATGLPSASAHAWALLAVSGLLGIALGDTFFFGPSAWPCSSWENGRPRKCGTESCWSWPAWSW